MGFSANMSELYLTQVLFSFSTLQILLSPIENGTEQSEQGNDLK